MILIEHRVNTVAQLRQMPTEHGAEIDIRTFGTRLVLNHQPQQDGDSLDDFLGACRHGPLILNVKEDGLEDQILAKVDRLGIANAFFLDITIPTALRLARKAEKRFAIRFSEFEPLEYCLRFAGLAQWCWVDCFHSLPLDGETAALLRKHFKLCLVSPELEGHDPEVRIPEFKRQLAGISLDAVCTDFPQSWKA